MLAVADLAGLSDVLDTWTLVDTLDTKSETTDTSAETADRAAWWDTPVRFTAQDVTQRVNAAARDLGLTDPAPTLPTRRRWAAP